MRVIEVVASRSVRVNTGNYEGTEHFVSMKAEVDELEDEASATERLCLTVDQALIAQLVLSYKTRGKRDMADPVRIARHHGLVYKGGG